MSEKRTIIAIDQGTTSSRAILFDEDGAILAQKSAEFPQIFPQDGWVEHDPEAIWDTTLDVTRAMVEDARSLSAKPLAIGITNQRETAIIWDGTTGCQSICYRLARSPHCRYLGDSGWWS